MMTRIILFAIPCALCTGGIFWNLLKGGLSSKDAPFICLLVIILAISAAFMTGTAQNFLFGGRAG